VTAKEITSLLETTLNLKIAVEIVSLYVLQDKMIVLEAVERIMYISNAIIHIQLRLPYSTSPSLLNFAFLTQLRLPCSPTTKELAVKRRGLPIRKRIEHSRLPTFSQRFEKQDNA
jgi:hypothetical protein